MNEAALKARRAYKRKWNREHPDKLKEYQERYWNRKAAQLEESEQAAAPDEQDDTQEADE